MQQNTLKIDANSVATRILTRENSRKYNINTDNYKVSNLFEAFKNVPISLVICFFILTSSFEYPSNTSDVNLIMPCLLRFVSFI